ncbi:MAG: hypothetical protein IKP88_13625 [Lachnospiraceae bacterium]|nr:hypothetical protein [Lachnospiraceae bacterium]
MIQLYDLPNLAITIILCVVFLILWLTLMLLAETIYQRMYRGFSAVFFFVVIINYLFFQMCLKEDYHIDFQVVAIYIVLMLIFDIVIIYKGNRYRKENFTVISVKQGLDAMSEGICFYTVDGLPQFVNKSMSDISIELTGKSIDDAVDFWNRLIKGNVAEGCEIVSSTEEMVIARTEKRVCAFSNRTMEAGDELKEMVMVDITSEYETFRELIAKKEALELQQARLREYNRNVTKATIEKELLTAKINIHDELGEILLAAKRYLTKGDIERKTITELWLKNLKLLGAENDNGEFDEYEEIYKAASDIGMNIVLDGELPQEEPAKTVVASALHENLTNTFRHAGGNTIYVKIRKEGFKTIVVFTNNGHPPEDTIVERGGLLSLRKIVEDAGFKMSIETDGGFALKLVL